MTYRDYDGNQRSICKEYTENVDAFLFLRSIRDMVGLEKKQAYFRRIADTIKVITDIDNLNHVDEMDVRKALRSIYGALSDSIHQAGARFTGNEQFVLPKAIPLITVPQVYAFASIVQEVGFVPVYELTGGNQY